MSVVKPLVIFSLLGLASLTGCGGVEPEGIPGENSLATQEQGSCSVPSPYFGCIGPVIDPAPKVCVWSNITWEYLCQTSNGCQTYDCGHSWSGHNGLDCSTFIAPYCN